MKTLRPLAFTLVEVMLATAILSLIVVLFATIISSTSNLWKRTTGKIEQFREARNAFETMTTRISQATLNTYWDYDNAAAPTKYERRSELRFISGPAKAVLPTAKTGVTRLTHSVFFMAPLGYTATAKYQNYDNLLCACGYYLEFGDDQQFIPPFLKDKIPPRYRHRLMEFLAPTENNSNNIYSYTSPPNKNYVANYKGKDWYEPLVNATPAKNVAPNSHPIAENIVALIITPRLSQDDEKQANGGTVTDESKLAPAYLYDSAPGVGSGTQYSDPLTNPTNQLPPVLQITMVAIDEASAIRLGFGAGSADIFGGASKFTASKDYGKDLLQSKDPASLEATLIDKRVNYRIFNTNVTIRGAKWSREQKN